MNIRTTKKTRIILIVLGIALGILFIISLVFAGIFFITAFVVSGSFSLFYENPPEPEIKNAEFEYYILFEFEGHNYEATGDFECNYSGVELLGTAGKYRRWEIKTPNGNEEVTLADVSNADYYTEFGEKIVEFYFDLGEGGYYMGEKFIVNPPNSSIHYTCIKSDGSYEKRSIANSDKAYEMYGIKIVSWQTDKPITNTY